MTIPACFRDLTFDGNPGAKMQVRYLRPLAATLTKVCNLMSYATVN